MDIDLVCLWVDGNDLKWVKKKEHYINRKINTKGRYDNNQN